MMKSRTVAEFFKGMPRDERGMALVIALLVLFMMSFLGTIVISTSNTEVSVTRRQSFRQDAFYAANRGMEYSVTDAAIYTTIGTGSLTVPLSGVNLSWNGSTASGTVQYVTSGNPPRGSGVDITRFKANYYVADVTGTGAGGSTVKLEENVARIVPKE